jgi:hypothetical protein
MKKNTNYFFFKEKFCWYANLLSILLIFISIIIYYLKGYSLFGVDFDQNTFTYETKLYDHQSTYFLKIYSLINDFSLSYNEVKDSYRYNNTYFVPLFVTSLISFCVGEKYTPIALDLFFFLPFLIVLNFFFTKVLNFKKIFSLSCVSIFYIFFGYGLTSIDSLYRFFLLKGHIDFPSLTRLFSPLLTSITLIIFFIVNFIILRNKKIKILFIFLIVLSFFVYPYNSLIQIIFSTLFLFYYYFFKKEKSIFLIQLYLIIFFSFFVSYYFQSHELTKNYNLILSVKNDHLAYLKNNTLLFFFIIVNCFIYYFKKNYFFIYASIFYLTCLIAYNLKFILVHDMQFYHIISYFFKPFQWINFFYLISLNKKIKLKLIQSTVFIAILFLSNQINFINNYFHMNSNLLKKQIENKKTFVNLKTLVRSKIVYTLDPDFIYYGYRLTNSYNYLFFSVRNLNISPLENVQRFVNLCSIHGLTRQQCYDLIYYNDKNFHLNDSHGVVRHLLFLHDGPDNKDDNDNFRSLGLTNYEFKNLFFNIKNNFLMNQDTFLLINKHDQKEFGYKINISKKKVYEDKRYILYQLN